MPALGALGSEHPVLPCGSCYVQGSASHLDVLCRAPVPSCPRTLGFLQQTPPLLLSAQGREWGEELCGC